MIERDEAPAASGPAAAGRQAARPGTHDGQVTRSEPGTVRARGSGPACPTPAALVAHRPIAAGGVQLGDGLLGQWQRRNLEASMPLALRQLEAAGNLANLRLAARGASDGYRGPEFMDSDIYKALEAIGWELAHTSSPVLDEFAHEATSLLEAAQEEDGYLNSHAQVTGGPRYARLARSHELYCAGHLIQAAIALRRGRGDERLLRVALRFADHLVASFSGSRGGLDGHPVIESALAELYRETGEDAYLSLAAEFVERRGRGEAGDSGYGSRYLQDHQPVRESVTEVGHVVRALYLEAGVVDVAAERRDRELLRGSVARWDDMVATKTYLTGGNGSRHAGESFGDRYELPPDRSYSETCAAIASFQWSWRLLLATGESKYADLMERILYNGFAASLSADGKRFFYVNPLQRRDDHYEGDDPGRRHEWFSCACCPPNIMRLIASLGHYVATVTDDTLFVHQFTASRISARLAGGHLSAEVATGYPWSGAVELRVKSGPAAPCGLALRVPGWSAGARFLVNRAPADTGAGLSDSGYLVVRRQWRPGDVLSCDLRLAPRLTYPSRRIDAVRGTAAIERGPLVYCFEQADQPPGAHLDDLMLTAGALREREVTLPGVGHTLLIEAGAVRLPATGSSGLPYLPTPDSGEAAGVPVTATALPYFQWDNRDGRAMRVWMPLGGPPGRPPAPAGTS